MKWPLKWPVKWPTNFHHHLTNTLTHNKAEAAGRVLAERQWWRVISSDLPRTRETTGHLLGQNPSAPLPAFSPLLREFSGGLREGQPIAVSEKVLLDAYQGPQPPPRLTSPDLLTRRAS